MARAFPFFFDGIGSSTPDTLWRGGTGGGGEADRSRRGLCTESLANENREGPWEVSIIDSSIPSLAGFFLRRRQAGSPKHVNPSIAKRRTERPPRAPPIAVDTGNGLAEAEEAGVEVEAALTLEVGVLNTITGTFIAEEEEVAVEAGGENISGGADVLVVLSVVVVVVLEVVVAEDQLVVPRDVLAGLRRLTLTPA